MGMSGTTMLTREHTNTTLKYMATFESNGKLVTYDRENKHIVTAQYFKCQQLYESALMYEIELYSGKIIHCTNEQKILTRRRNYISAENLRADKDAVVDLLNRKNKELSLVKRVTNTGNIIDMYGIEVPRYHCVILCNGIVLHDTSTL